MVDVKTVYDFADKPVHLLSFVFFTGALLCLGYVWIIWERVRRKIRPFLDEISDRPKLGIIALGVICCLIGYMHLNIKDYIYTKHIYKTKQFKQTLGYITGYRDRLYSKHYEINFTINGLNFEFSDNNSLYACNYNDISHTPIEDSSLVRVYYFTDNGTNRVLRIETFK